MKQKQMCYRSKGRRLEHLFYNNSSASHRHWSISTNNTLRLFLVPYPFKIEASLQNSLSLQCTHLWFFFSFSFSTFIGVWLFFNIDWFYLCKLLPVRLPTNDRRKQSIGNILYHEWSSLSTLPHSYFKIMTDVSTKTLTSFHCETEGI